MKRKESSFICSLFTPCQTYQRSEMKDDSMPHIVSFLQNNNEYFITLYIYIMSLWTGHSECFIIFMLHIYLIQTPAWKL